MNDTDRSMFINVKNISRLCLDLRLAFRTLLLLWGDENRKQRKKNGLDAGDALFNIRKLLRLSDVLMRYRYPVRFGDKIVLDSAFPPYPSKGFDKRLSNYLNYLDMGEMPPGIVSLSITNRCPYACEFCSTNAQRLTEELDEELLKKTIREIEALGIPFIILHGGEPMFRYERFLRLVKHVHPDTCLWMFTSGYGVNRRRAQELKDNGLFGVWVSLDHYDPLVHNTLRRNPQAFDNACKAVEYFREAGVYTCLSLVPPPELQLPENFRKYYDLARDMGVAEIRIMEMKPTGREACRGVTAHSPVLERLQKELFQNPGCNGHPPLSGLSTWLEKDEALGCQCRFEYLYITPSGDVQPCEASEITFGNIQAEDFADIYRRICKAFPRPSTGCIPMVMYSEIREYQKAKDQMTMAEKIENSFQIMEGFRERGKIPGAYEPIWPDYERRLKDLRKRRSRL